MITPSGLPHIALSEILYTKASTMRVPLSGTFELSPVCNFSCKMCYVRKTAKEVAKSPRKILTLDGWLRIAREARDAGMLFLLLTGGEPLLWPDFWTLYDELVDMGFIVTINTNGSLLNFEAAEHFRRKPPQCINITLYGASDDTYYRLCGVRGVLNRVDQAVQHLQQAGIAVKLNCSLTPDNAADLDLIVDYATARNIPLSVVTYMFPPIRRDPSMVGVNERFTPEEAARYMLHFLSRTRDPNLYRGYLQNILNGYAEPLGLDESCIDPVDGHIRCRAGKASFWVTWDGWLLPCGMMPEPRIDLQSVDFASGWESLADGAAALQLSGICSKCTNRNTCHPCAAMAYAETGKSTGIPTYLCRMTQEMNKIARETLFPEAKI